MAITRSLGKKGIEVTCGDSSKKARSFYSKYCKNRVIYPSQNDEPERFLDFLTDHLKNTRYDVFFPVTDATILCILKDIDQLLHYTNIPINDYETQMKALDKSQTLRIASEVNVPFPKTFHIKDIGELEDIANTLDYPVVIKPRQTAYRLADRVCRGITTCVSSREEFTAKYLELHQIIPYPLIQEFISGPEIGLYVLIHNGKLKAVFSQRRLRSFDPLGGASVLRQSVRVDPQMMEYTLRLLGKIGWNGIAMTEFKIDSRDHTPKLMEINGRFWGSLQTSAVCGVDFPYLLFRIMMGEDIEPVMEYREGIKCRYLLGDFTHLFKVMKGSPSHIFKYPKRLPTLWNFMKFYQKDMFYDNFSSGDYMVGIRTFLNFLFSIPKLLFGRAR